MDYKKTKEYLAHKKLGFPKIDDNIQSEMLVTRNYQPIRDICPDIEIFSLEILAQYITITKKQFKEYLHRTNYINQQIDEFSPTFDGLWLEKTEEKYVLFERERGSDYNHIYFNNENDVLEYYVTYLGQWIKN